MGKKVNLVLGMQEGESIIIDDNKIEIIRAESRSPDNSKQVRLLFKANRDVDINRKSVYENKKKEGYFDGK